MLGKVGWQEALRQQELHGSKCAGLGILRDGKQNQLETPRTTLIPVPLQPAKVPTIFHNIISSWGPSEPMERYFFIYTRIIALATVDVIGQLKNSEYPQTQLECLPHISEVSNLPIIASHLVILQVYTVGIFTDTVPRDTFQPAPSATAAEH